MSRFTFGVDEMPDGERQQLIFGACGWQRYDENGPETPRFDGSGVKMTPFGKEIDGVPVTEITRIHHEARERLNKLDQENWRHLAARCWKIAAYKTPRLRAMVASALLGGMHDSDPPDLEEFAEATGNSVIDAADELCPVYDSEVGGVFRETDRGVLQPEIYWDQDDIPEEDDDDDDGFGDLEIGSVEA